eukprot:752431-Hanusia_phi.AAC.2
MAEEVKEDFSTGPLSLLADSVRKNCQRGIGSTMTGGRSGIWDPAGKERRRAEDRSEGLVADFHGLRDENI